MIALVYLMLNLFDKNGKEIFEGDIITDGFRNVDIRNHFAYGFYTIFKGRESFFGDGKNLATFEESAEKLRKSFEIIGNIYENPELLENN